jgi:hypothetical protein
MGGVDAVVNLGISTIDVAYFPLGIFLIAGFYQLRLELLWGQLLPWDL